MPEPAEVVRRFWTASFEDLADVVDDDVDYRAIEGARTTSG
jgi:hypothetical protein